MTKLMTIVGVLASSGCATMATWEETHPAQVQVAQELAQCVEAATKRFAENARPVVEQTLVPPDPQAPVPAQPAPPADPPEPEPAP